ncbi:uncharacterized protein LOC141931053 isoform X2 [Strix aluco]|uniref:uncharacterized protein LOC141931053 isoform X2 n=1 Tax=Strix aluco TaxID=111821 RepID=UPI003DA4CB6F
MPLALPFQLTEEQAHFHILLNLATLILLLFSAWKFPLFMCALKVLVGLGPGKHRQAETQMAEHRKNSLQSALQEEAAALKKETVTLHQKVASLERKLETTEKHRRDVLAAAEGEQLSWLSEKRLLSQRLERLQQTVARLELEKKELKQLIAELRRTLEQVKPAFTASAKPHGPLEHNTIPQTALWSPLLVSFPLPLSSVDTHFGIFSLFSHPIAFTNAHSLQYHPSCPSVPIRTHVSLSCQELFPLALSLP